MGATSAFGTASAGPPTTALALRPRDFLTALLLGAAFAAAYAAFPQSRLHHDACWMLWHHHLGDMGQALHLLHLPLAGLLGWFLPARLDLAAPVLLSALSGGVGLFGCLLFLRRMGVHLGAAALWTTVVGVSPALVFWATQVDAHGLHFAGVSLSLLGLTYAASLGGAKGLWVGAAIAALPGWTHQSGAILGLGMVLLFVRLRGVARGRAFAGEVLRVGAVFLCLSVVFVAVSALIRTGELPFLGAYSGEEARRWGGEQLFQIRSSALVQSVDGAGLLQWWGAHGLLLPLAAVALLFARGERLWSLGLLFPASAFYLWWRVPEEGGYYVHQLPVLALLCARAAPKGLDARPLWLLPLVLVQAALAFAKVSAFDRGFDPRVRVELVRELGGERPLVLGFVQDLPPIGLWLPESERDVRAPELVEAFLTGFDPELFGSVGAEAIGRVMLPKANGEGRVLLVDLSNPGSFDRVPSGPAAQPYLDAVERHLLAQLACTLHERDGWRIARIDGLR